MTLNAKKSVQTKLPASLDQERGAVVIIDSAGRIAVSSAAAMQLLGWQDDALAGRPLSTAISDLPFTENTPGYNIAYAIVNRVDERWTQHKALSGDGTVAPIEVAVSNVTKRLPFFITLKLRPTATHSRLQA